MCAVGHQGVRGRLVDGLLAGAQRVARHLRVTWRSGEGEQACLHTTQRLHACRMKPCQQHAVNQCIPPAADPTANLGQPTERRTCDATLRET